MFFLALCKRSQANCFQMAVRGGYIHHSTEWEERKSSGGLSKAFCSTDEGISCLDLGGINYLFMGDVFVWTACREGQSMGHLSTFGDSLHV